MRIGVFHETYASEERLWDSRTQRIWMAVFALALCALPLYGSDYVLAIACIIGIHIVAALGNFAIAAAVITGFLLFFHYSRTGIALRATASDPVTASTMGINVRYAQRLTWILAGAVGTMAGVLIGASGGLSPLLASTALSVFAVIILGGMDSVLGVIVASLLIGWLESVVVGYVGGKVRDVLPYLVVLAILVVKPYGLFGSRDIERL